ncbi:hypothetical protein HLB02_22120 [Serratia nevei]|nr:hypothetical protein [Serratia nevei]
MDVMKAASAARKVYGQDISILVALSVARGDESNLIIVSGKKQDVVARDITRFAGKRVRLQKREQFSFIEEKNYMTTEISF